ncbi:MAG: hypothetical protein IIA61_12310 [Candidatus Marinimicrobia bacterium]|nr:hypothetical protein [Candidatus Neomarinimicrobiota bacterium]
MTLTIILFIAALVVIILVNHFFFWKPLNVNHFYRNGAMMMGHRGSPMEAPENTIPSYLKAVDQGLSMIELDVVTTKDRKVVCSHNFDLERETDGYGYIYNKTYSELASVNAGIKFPELAPCKLPLLEEVIDVLPDDFFINIEIKTKTVFDLKSVKLVVNIVKKQNLHHRVLISSFHPLVIGLVKIFDPRIPTAYIWSDEDVPDILKKPRFVDLVHPDMFHPESHLVTSNLVRFAKRKGLRVNVWTVNNLPAMHWLLDTGIDGIISDFPHLMLETLKQEKKA